MVRVIRGYSLIEMLVVLIIIGLLVSVVSLSTGLGQNGRADLERVGANLEQLLSVAADEAVLRGTPIGLSFVPPQPSEDPRWMLRWFGWQPQIWMELFDFMPTQYLPERLVPRLIVEGEEFSAADLMRINASGLPTLVFYPTGESTLFTLQLHDEINARSLVQLSNLDDGLVARLAP